MAEDIDTGQSNTTIDQALAPAETDSNPAAATVDTTASAQADMTFFDPEAVPEPLKGAYKSMQGEFTRKMQDLASLKKSDDDVAKIEAFNRFAADPQATIRALAAQHGITLEQATAATNGDLASWQPSTWQEVVDTTASRAQSDLMTRLEPMITPMVNELQNLKSKDIRNQLDESYPEWRRHESEMKTLLEKHPSLHDDPVTLAKLAIPEAEHEAKAFKKAMGKFEKNAKSSKVSSGSIGVQSSAGSNEKLSFQESILKAKRSMGQ